MILNFFKYILNFPKNVYSNENNLFPTKKIIEQFLDPLNQQ